MLSFTPDCLCFGLYILIAKVVVGFIWAMAAGNSWLLFIIATDYEGENSIKRKRISY
jgi:hypothetical protein